MTVKEDDGSKEDILDQEVSQEDEEEQVDYDAEFDAQWGDDTKPQEPAEPKDEDQADPGPDEALTKDDDPKDEGEPAPEPDKLDDPYSWIDSLPTKIKAKAEQLKHSAQSDSGRISAYNTQLADLKDELARMRSRPVQKDPVVSDSKTSEPAVHELPEKFKQLKEDFPEFADAVDALREYDRKEFEKQLEAKLQPLEDARVVKQRDDFSSAVDVAAEDIFSTKDTGTHWREVVRGDDFKAWLRMQPHSVQQAATMPDAAEAINVLTRYESDYQAAIAKREPAPVDEGEPENKGNNQPNKADKLKEKRTKRKKESVAPGSKPIISDPNAEGGDYNAQFDAMWG